MKESGQMKAVFTIARYASENDRIMKVRYSDKEAKKLFGIKQFTRFEKNCLLNEGINELFTLICSASGTKFDNTNAQVGTGTDSTPADPSDSALTNGVWKGMEGGYPTYGTSQKATWKGIYGSGDANQAWNEFSVRNGATADIMLHRKVSSQGTKQSGQTWELTIEISLS